MIVRTEVLNNILIIGLGEVYSNDTVADLMNLSKSAKVEIAKHIIVDCSNLKAIDSMGTELFQLEEKVKKDKGKLLLSSLDKDAENTLNLLGRGSGYSPIRNANSLEEAITQLDSEIK